MSQRDIHRLIPKRSRLSASRYNKMADIVARRGYSGFSNGLVDRTGFYTRPQRVSAATSGLREKLAAWYPFSNHANDISGNQHDGTLQGDATVSRDILELDGTGDYVTTASDFIGTGAVCIAFWMRVTSTAGAVIHNGKFIITAPAHLGRITVYSDGTNATNSSLWLYDDTDWVQIAVNRYTDGTVDVYANGVADITATAGTTPEAGTTNVTIGGTAAGASLFRGALDDFRIYKGTLTGDQINEVYQEGQHHYFHAKQTGGAAKLFAVVSAGTGDGIYNCYEQKLDATDWAGTGGVSKIVNKNTTSTEVQNLAEFDTEPEYVAQLAAGDLLLAFWHGDDESTLRWIGVPFIQGAHGSGNRLAYCSEAAPASTVIAATLDHTTGTAINVTCHIRGGTALDAALPRLVDNDPMIVTEIAGTWYCTGHFQTSEDCVCSV